MQISREPHIPAPATRTRTHTRAHTREHAHTQLQEGHRELLAQMHVSVTQGCWGARLQGCRPPWARLWPGHRSSESSPLSKAGSPGGGALTGSELQLTQPHTSLSPQAFSRPANRSGGQTQSNSRRHLAANSADITMTRGTAVSLSSCGDSSVPLVADDGRARVRTTHALPLHGRTFPRPQAATASGCGQGQPESLLRGLETSAPHSGGPQPAPLRPLRTVPRLQVQLPQGAPGEAWSGVWRCPRVLPAPSGRGQEAQVTDSSAHPALNTNRHPKAPGGFQEKRPFPA